VEVNGKHFLTNSNGVDVWPNKATVLNEVSAAANDQELGKHPWGTVIGACLLVNLITLIGVIFLVPVLTSAIRRKTLGGDLKKMASSSNYIFIVDEQKQRLFNIFITSFACGALLATTVFLIIPEAILLVNDPGEGEDTHEDHEDRMLQEDGGDSPAGHDDVDKNWVFGTSAMAGFLFPMFLASFIPHHHGNHHVEADNANTDSNEGSRAMLEPEEPEREERKQVNWKLVVGLTVGDALHNFADGIFIGVAFLLCEHSLAWSVFAGTIYHELAQEVSDFFLLTQHAHLPPLKALALNFTSGLSVLLGGIVILSTDISNYALGVILSMSAGVYINVAAKECMSTVDPLADTPGRRALAFFAFAMGAIPIGLVLLNHAHCEA
jgi:zinc transporter ZupT